MNTGSLLLAHQGGWDELLFVLVPIALFAGLLALANRRATKEQATRGRAEGEQDVQERATREDADPPDSG